MHEGGRPIASAVCWKVPPCCWPPSRNSLCPHVSHTAGTMEDSNDGLYCSTAGAYFDNKDSLTEHYRSDFHRWERPLQLLITSA